MAYIPKTAASSFRSLGNTFLSKSFSLLFLLFPAVRIGRKDVASGGVCHRPAPSAIRQKLAAATFFQSLHIPHFIERLRVDENISQAFFRNLPDGNRQPAAGLDCTVFQNTHLGTPDAAPAPYQRIAVAVRERRRVLQSPLFPCTQGPEGFSAAAEDRVRSRLFPVRLTQPVKETSILRRRKRGRLIYPLARARRDEAVKSEKIYADLFRQKVNQIRHLLHVRSAHGAHHGRAETLLPQKVDGGEGRVKAPRIAEIIVGIPHPVDAQLVCKETLVPQPVNDLCRQQLRIPENPDDGGRDRRPRIGEQREETRKEQGVAAGEMDAAVTIPCREEEFEIVDHFFAVVQGQQPGHYLRCHITVPARIRTGTGKMPLQRERGLSFTRRRHCYNRNGPITARG
jgi:hypothetical protein